MEENMQEIYKQLTGVDIKEQKQIWDERGKGYYGEFLLFCELYKKINGQVKVLMNLNVPINNSTTEIDLLMIHETGFYVFECKHYKGRIYGNESDETWTQWFKTVDNVVFPNPIIQNKYHIKALSTIYSDIPAFSSVVFTHPDSILNIKYDNRNGEVCNIEQICNILNNKIKQRQIIMNAQDIERIFKELSNYSPMLQPIKLNHETKPFFTWLNFGINEFKSYKKILEAEIKKTKKIKITSVVLSVVIAIVCIICLFIGNSLTKLAYEQKYDQYRIECDKEMALYKQECDNIANQAVEELKIFKQKYLKIDQIDNKYIKDLSKYTSVENVEIFMKDGYPYFKANIIMQSEDYGFKFTEGSQYIITTTDGNIYEYNVFGEHLYFNSGAQIVYGKGKICKLYGASCFGINNIEEIEYVKLTGISLFKRDIYGKNIAENLEIELFDKTKLSN